MGKHEFRAKEMKSTYQKQHHVPTNKTTFSNINTLKKRNLLAIKASIIVTDYFLLF
jgi:hypothetical protein